MEVREVVIWWGAGYRPGCVFSGLYFTNKEVLVTFMRVDQPSQLMLHDLSNAIVTLNPTIQLPLLQKTIYLTH